MLLSKRIRVTAGFTLLAILTLSISGSARAEHGYGPTGPVRGESVGGTGALFGPDGCGTLNNSGLAGYPQTAYGANAPVDQPVPQPSRVQPTAAPSTATPSAPSAPAKTPEPTPTDTKAKSTADDADKASKSSSSSKPNSSSAKDTASKDKDLIAAGSAAMGKCVSCHEKDGGPSGTPSSRPSHMPPKGSMSAEEIKAVDAYLASKG